MKSLIKNKPVMVLLNDADRAALQKLVGLEREIKEDLTIGMGTVLRQLAMPEVARRTVELEAQKVAKGADPSERRTSDRRHAQHA